MSRVRLTDVLIFVVLLFFLLFISAAEAQKKLPIPVKISQNEDGSSSFLTYSDLDQIKLMSFGWLIAALLWVLKTAWDMWQKKNDKSSEQLESITDTLTRLEERFRHFEVRLDHLDKTQPTQHQVHDLVRKEIEWFERMKSGKQ